MIEGEHFAVALVVLHRDLALDVVALAPDHDRPRVDHFLVLVEPGDEFLEAALIVELVRPLLFAAQVVEELARDREVATEQLGADPQVIRTVMDSYRDIVAEMERLMVKKE